MINEKNYFEQHKDEIFEISNTSRTTSDGKKYRLALADSMRFFMTKNGITQGRVENEGDGTKFDAQWSAFIQEHNGVKK